MKPNNNNLIPFKAIHPGEIIKDELEAIDMTQKELAILLGVKSSYCLKLIFYDFTWMYGFKRKEKYNCRNSCTIRESIQNPCNALDELSISI